MTPRNTAIIKAYQDGNSLHDVGAMFDLSFEGIRKILKRYGVERRRRGQYGGLSPKQLAAAKIMYTAGKSTWTIAREIGAAQETVRSALIRAGIVMRSPSHAIRLGLRDRKERIANAQVAH